jgi:hypothetical protein
LGIDQKDTGHTKLRHEFVKSPNQIRIYDIGSSSECVGPVKLSFPVMTPLDRHVGLENSQIFVDTRKNSANFHAAQSLKVSFQGNENSFSF